jgi:hypothetical protein
MPMFSGARSVSKTRQGVRLTGQKGIDYELEKSSLQVILTSSSLIVRSHMTWDRLDSVKPPTSIVSVQGEFFANGDNLYGFREPNFLGPIELITVRCESRDQSMVHAKVYEPDPELNDGKVALHITCFLLHDQFKELFHPIWIRQAQSILDVILEMDGYQWGPEASFRGSSDAQNLAFDAHGEIPAKFRSIILATEIQEPQAKQSGRVV